MFWQTNYQIFLISNMQFSVKIYLKLTRLLDTWLPLSPCLFPLSLSPRSLSPICSALATCWVLFWSLIHVIKQTLFFSSLSCLFLSLFFSFLFPPIFYLWHTTGRWFIWYAMEKRSKESVSSCIWHTASLKQFSNESLNAVILLLYLVLWELSCEISEMAENFIAFCPSICHKVSSPLGSSQQCCRIPSRIPVILIII